MSKKSKKLSKIEKQERRIKELQKAESATLYRTVEKRDTTVTSATKQMVNATPEKQEKYTLPILEIKRDLWKNLIYAGFSIVVVVVLKITLKL